MTVGIDLGKRARRREICKAEQTLDVVTKGLFRTTGTMIRRLHEFTLPI